MMVHSMMMMNTHQGRINMGVFKQMMIDKMDELHGGDIEGLTEQDIIDAMVDEYMRSEEYHKEHMDQEKKIANSLTSSDSSAKI